tara:strand:- start:89 stop:355 length:267 start_codon:yes stop_codon:yes gene_type:complete
MTNTNLKAIKILSNEKAHKILKYIVANQPISVSKIYKGLGYEQSETSTFLRKLRDAGHVVCYREGKNIYYSIDKDNIKNTFEEYLKEF